MLKKISKRSIRKSRAHIKIILDELHNISENIILIFDNEGITTYCSLVCAKTIGFSSSDEVIGISYKSFLSLLIDQSWIDVLFESLKLRGEYNGILSVQKDSDTTLFYRSSVKKISTSKKDYFIVMYLVDITELESKNRRIQQGIELRDHLITAISHEIRTPLHAIMASAELLSLSNDFDNVDIANLNNLLAASKALLTTVNQITDYAKIQTGEIIFKKQYYNFLEWVDQVTLGTTFKLKEKGCILLIHLDPSIPKSLIGDKERIRQVIYWILLRVTQTTTKEYICLSIKVIRKYHKEYLEYVVEDINNIEDMLYINSRNNNLSINHFLDINYENYKVINISYLNQMFEFELNLMNDIIDKMGGKINYYLKQEGVCFSFMLELKTDSTQPLLKAAELPGCHALCCTDSSIFGEHIKELLGQLRIDCDLSENFNQDTFYSFVILDERANKIRKFLNIEYKGNPCKILIVDEIKEKNSLYSLVDKILHHPFDVSKLVQILYDSEDAVECSKTKDLNTNIFQTEGVHALLVDDNEVNLLVLEKMLERFDISCDIALSGENAIKMAISKIYDIIFMDYIMPEMNGLETTKKLREIAVANQFTPIIVISANKAERTKLLFGEERIDAVLAKPLEMIDLSEILEKWLPKEKSLKKMKTTFSDQEENDLQENDETNAWRLEQGIKQYSLDTFIRIFSNMEDLDVTQLLSRIGGHLQAYDILSIATDNIGILLGQLQQPENRKLYLHSLRGILLNINANELAKLVRKWEEDNCDNEAILIEYDRFLASLHCFHYHLSNALKEFKEYEYILHFGGENYDADTAYNIEPKNLNIQQKQTTDKWKRERSLEELKTYLEGYDYEKLLKEIMRMLPEFNLEERQILIKVKEQVAKFQYNEARELINQLKIDG